MYGLCDCNNFYASCERVFRPDLVGRPVVVLSNNDGCIIARSNEAKALGIGMGQPFYQVRPLIEQGQVTVFSANFALYGDLSRRVMATLRSLVPGIEIYSIDEAFFRPARHGRTARRVRQNNRTHHPPQRRDPRQHRHRPDKDPGEDRLETGQAISPSRRMLLHAPPGGYRQGAAEISTAGCLGHRTPLRADVRPHGAAHGPTVCRPAAGVGPRPHGCRGAADLERTAGGGVHHVRTDAAAQAADYPITQLPREIHTLEELDRIVAEFASMCAEKLRGEQSVCAEVQCYLYTNRHREDQPQRCETELRLLPEPTDSSPEIVRQARITLRQLFQPGYGYKKAGVILSRITPASELQGSLFSPLDRGKHARLMDVMDTVNKRLGKGKDCRCGAGYRTVSHEPGTPLTALYDRLEGAAGRKSRLIRRTAAVAEKAAIRVSSRRRYPSPGSRFELLAAVGNDQQLVAQLQLGLAPGHEILPLRQTIMTSVFSGRTISLSVEPLSSMLSLTSTSVRADFMSSCILTSKADSRSS